jgi:hypothetical protein
MKKTLLVISVLTFIPAFSYIAFGWNPFKKQTLEDCLLENLKGVKSDDAAADIKFACIVKTSDNESSSDTRKCQNRALTDDEMKLINATALVESHGWMTVKIHNGNSNIKINGVKVKLIDIETAKEFSYDLSHYNVEPLKTSKEMLAQLLYAPKKWNWYLYDLTTEVCK